jgi:hypothetical protein
MKIFFVPTRDTHGFSFRKNKIKERKSISRREDNEELRED